MNEEINQAITIAKDPTSYSWVTYLWVMLLSAWGGMVKFLNNLRDKRVSLKEATLDLVVGMVTSVFVGVVTFYICEATNVSALWSAVCIAIAGHMGAELIRFFQDRLKSRIASIFAQTKNDGTPNG